MKKDLTELIFILDRSGSMSNLASDTIGGYNSMIEKQRKEPGEAMVTTVLFDDEYKMIYDHIPIKDVPELTHEVYFPRGTTALLDAIGRTVNSVGERLANTPEDERPDQVIVVITTDGLENASREFDRKKIKEMIEHQQSKYSWTFMFLGANMDAVKEASNIGIDSSFANTYTNSSAGLNSVYEGVSCSLSAMRSYNSFATSGDAAMSADEVVEVRKQRAKAVASAKIKNDIK